MTALLEAVEAAGDSGGTGPLIGHHAHPDDPSQRTALCGEEILGVPAFGDFQVCIACQIMRAAQDSEPLSRSRHGSGS